MTTIDTLLVSTSPGETRVALLASGRLVGLPVARAGDDSVVGNIYLGRVEAAVKGLEAAFVDIGLDRAGFLALAEARPPDAGAAGDTSGDDGIGDYAAEGDAVLVQAQRDSTDDKGAKLTTHVHLAGVNLVLRPEHPGVSVSRRITDDGTRDRLSAAMVALAPEGAGFIVRTAAAEADAAALEREARALADRWAQVRLKRANSKAPALLLAAPDVAQRALRDFGAGVGRVVADDARVLARLKAFAEAEMPGTGPVFKAHRGAEPLFEAFAVEAQIEAALAPRVALAGGGAVIVSETPALAAIDVDTGGADAGAKERTALEVNLEAAAEIAAQVRLRNLSGLIVIDFVPLRQADHRRRLLDALRDAVAGDPLGPHVVGTTPMGLVEMTRRRHGLTLTEIYAGPWSDRAGAGPPPSPGSQALAALRRAMLEGRGSAAALTLRVPPAVADALRGPVAAALEEAAATLGVAIEVAQDQSMADGECAVEPGQGQGRGGEEGA